MHPKLIAFSDNSKTGVTRRRKTYGSAYAESRAAEGNIHKTPFFGMRIGVFCISCTTTD